MGVIDGARTHDRSDHNRVLYQLSYDHHETELYKEPAISSNIMVVN